MEFNSLVDFYQKIICTRLPASKTINVLDIGCGSKSIFENIENEFNVVAIDKSVDAILNVNFEKINYQISSIEQFSSSYQFELILDSHAIHCILENENRELAFKNVYNLLSDDGIFAAEMMIQPNQKIFFKDRMIKSSIEIENELKELKFKILYFVIVPNLIFLDDENKKQHCDLLRIICSK